MTYLMKKIFIAGSLSIVLLMQAGCTAIAVANQPKQKNLAVFSNGITRDEVIQEIGQPTTSVKKSGKQIDTFSFNQGTSMAHRAGRIFLHSVAGTVSVGMWDFIGPTVEAKYGSTPMQYEVTYNKANVVEKVVKLK